MELCYWLLTLVVTASVSHQRIISVEDESTQDVQNENSFDVISDVYCNYDRRYTKHYEARGCTPLERDSCGYPTKYNCPSINEIERNVCYYDGKIYEPGSSIVTGDPCQKCRCSVGPESDIICASTECPQTKENTTSHCHDIFEMGTCCPTNNVCVEDDSSERESDIVTCEYNGERYPLGAKMITKDDPCEVCLCTQDWINSNGTETNCYQTSCIPEDYRSKLIKGCVPIYQEDTCCPVDFYCGLGAEFPASNETQEPELPQEGLQCVFLGKSYKVGETVSVSGEFECLSCVCQILPDVTCVQKSCPPNPNVKNCFPYNTPNGGCCPEYECMMGDKENNATEESGVTKREMESEDPVEPQASTCSDILCNDGMVCMLYHVSCESENCPPVPTCMLTNSSCPTPLCDIGCVVTEQDNHGCPTCVCGTNIERNPLEPKCPMPQCPHPECLIVAGEDGCPICSCTVSCSPLECPAGCNVEKEVEGQCPKCICEDETEGCPTPVCAHEGCKIENLPNGCPTCVCDSENAEREFEDEDQFSQDEPERSETSREPYRVNNLNEQQSSQNPIPEYQQQQQQQQQQRSFGSEDMDPPVVREFSDEYDGTIVAMSDGPFSDSRTSEKLTEFYNSRRDAAVPKNKLLIKPHKNKYISAESTLMNSPFQYDERFYNPDRVRQYVVRPPIAKEKPEP